jgi:hypothetical protein
MTYTLGTRIIRRRSLAGRCVQFPALVFLHYTILRESGTSRRLAFPAAWKLASCVFVTGSSR